MDRGTLIRTYTGGGPRLHPPLAAPVPLAHRLRAAADRRRAAPRRGDRAHARPAQPGGAGLHRHRPALRPRRRRGAEGLPHRRLPRQRVRPVQHPRSRTRPSTAVRPPHGHEPVAASRTATSSTSSWSPTARRPATAATTRRNRCSARSTTPTACSARRRPRRSTSRLEPKESLRHVQHRPLRPRLPAGPAADRSRAPASSKSPPSTSRSSTGTRTTTATRRLVDLKKHDRRARSRSSCSTWRSAACWTAR